jgi:YD repeat-containing protein
VDSIRDPDNQKVKFGYSGSRITSRTDRRGTVTSYAYNGGANRLSQVRIDPPGLNITTSFTPAKTRGLATDGVAISFAADSAFTLLDGPRTDVVDHTRFWVDRFDAPSKIRDALGHETLLVRGDAVFPALVTRIQQSNGFVTEATYNARGNLTHSTQFDPYDTGQNATTTYHYTNNDWPDFPTHIIAPEGDLIRSDYHPNGNRAWQQMGNLSATRTPLGYWTVYEKDALGRDTMVYSAVDTDGKTIEDVRANGAWVRTKYYNASDRPQRVTSWGPGVTAASLVGQRTLPGDSVWLTYLYDEEGNTRTVTRQYTPELGSPYVTHIPTDWIYDAAGRVKEYTQTGSSTEYYTLDPAGNVVQTVTRRGHAIESSYDALGRLTRRVVPQVDFQAAASRRIRPTSNTTPRAR